MEKERIIKIMNELLEVLGLNTNQLASALGMSRAQAIYDVLNPAKKVGISKAMADKICGQFPQISKSYLLTGDGDLIRNTGVVMGSNGKIGDHSGNINRNNINLALPEKGVQKIIKPNGTVKIVPIPPDSEAFDELKKENLSLRLENSYLKDTICLKDDLIASLRETIKLLSHS